MPYTVFFAWQQDRHKNVCRWFIHKAAEDAIAEVVSGLRLEDAPAVDPEERADSEEDLPIELDEATKGLPGSPMIAETIATKIKSCGVFIADVTPVTKMKTEDGREKSVPNPNVMVELGIAAASVSWERIILVMNTAFGRIEDLPFDLKHRSCRISYHLDDPKAADKATKRKVLAKAIAAELKVMHEAGVWTKSDEGRKRQEAERELKQLEAARTVRQKFEADVEGGRFFKFRADRGIVALSIIPLNKLVKPLTVQRYDSTMMSAFRPLGQEGVIGGICPVVAPKSIYYRGGSEDDIQGITEVREDGCCLAVLNMTYDRAAWAKVMYEHFNAPPPVDDQNQPWLQYVG